MAQARGLSATWACRQQSCSECLPQCCCGSCWTLLAELCAHSSDSCQVPHCCWGHQPAQLLLQGFRKEIKARIMRCLSARRFCSDTLLWLWAEDPNKMMVLFLSSRIILVASELLGASFSQQKIDILCLSRNIFTSLLKKQWKFHLVTTAGQKKQHNHHWALENRPNDQLSSTKLQMLIINSKLLQIMRCADR